MSAISPATIVAPMPAGPAVLPAQLPSLDGIRGLAIALVLVHNVNLLHEGSDALGRALAWLTRFGWIGVQLFFVLSGFLITRNLLETRGASNWLNVFYARRALRIMPLYYATLIGVFVVWPWFGHWPAQFAADAPQQIWLWLFLDNWTQMTGLGGASLPHFWSLALEEQFYLIWPLILLRRTLRQVLVACAVVALVALLARVGMWYARLDPILMYTFTVSRMDALAVGAAAATLTFVPGLLPTLVAWRAWLLWAALAALLAGRFIPHGYWIDDSLGSVFGYSALTIGFSLFVLGAACSDSVAPARGSRVLWWPVLRVLGKYSYALYVLHPLIDLFVVRPALQRWIGPQLPTTWQAIAHVLVVSLLSLGAAWLSYHLLEKRFLALKRYFVPEYPVAQASAR